MPPFRFVLTLIVLVGIPLQAASQQVEFEELKSRRSRQLFIHYLDGYLSLNQQQHESLEELLKGMWSAENSAKSRVLLWSGYKSGTAVFRSMKESNLADVLSEEQLLQFESLHEHALNQSEQSKYLRGESADEVTVDPINTTLAQAILLEVQRTEELLELNEQQVRFLRVAAKGAASRVLAERQEMRELLMTGNYDISRGFEWVAVAVEGPAFRIRKAGVWQSALKKVLTEQQYTIFLNDQNSKSKVSSQVSSHSLAMSYFHKEKLSLDEYRRFTKLIEDGITEAREAGQVKHNSSMAFDSIVVLMNLEDDQIKSTLTPESWNVLEPILERIRESYQADNPEKDQ